MRYTVVLEQEEDGGYVVSVPALPGCVSQGDTRGDTLSNIQEAIAVYLEDCRDAGDPTEAAPAALALALVLTFGLAALSYYAVEQPLLA